MLNYMKIISLKVNVKNTVNIIATTISWIKMWKDDYTAETKVSIRTQMKLMEPAEKELDRAWDRKKQVNLNDILIRLKKGWGQFRN